MKGKRLFGAVLVLLILGGCGQQASASSKQASEAASTNQTATKKVEKLATVKLDGYLYRVDRKAIFLTGEKLPVFANQHAIEQYFNNGVHISEGIYPTPAKSVNAYLVRYTDGPAFQKVHFVGQMPRRTSSVACSATVDLTDAAGIPEMRGSYKITVSE